MPKIKIGLIGGSGLGEALTAQADGHCEHPATPYGKPSAGIITTEWNGVPIAVLARHGDGHCFSPSHVPYRANIYALKQLGCTHIIASGAVGSLREDIHPGELLIPDQIIDKTFARETSFFGNGIAAHVEFDQPYCQNLRKIIVDAAEGLDATVHDGGTYVCMEGPQFSTVAESELHRTWGGDVIGMTTCPEAKLAREAEIAYALIALPTDYDCWKPKPAGKEKNDLLAEILSNLKRGTNLATELIKLTLTNIAEIGPDGLDCPCRHSLELGIWTDRSKIAPAAVRELQPLVGRYFEGPRRCKPED